MADLLRIRVNNGGPDGFTYEWADQGMTGKVVLDQPPSRTLCVGDVWEVELVTGPRTVKGRKGPTVVRLIAKVSSMKPWQNITELPNFWIDPVQLQCLLVWLNNGVDVILQGPKGTGKTSLPYAVTQALGWQDPLKIDVYTLRSTVDLFGSDAAVDGSTLFRRSAFLDYIEAAITALRQKLDTQFLVVLDEINRVHEKSKQGMHGLFDHTRQVSFVTAGQGNITVTLPPNLHVIGTMNPGYAGTYEIDEAMLSRFQFLSIQRMPADYETKRLSQDERISEGDAGKIVTMARMLAGTADQGKISYGPSYRECQRAAILVREGVSLRTACIMSLLDKYTGRRKVDFTPDPADPGSEYSVAWSAIGLAGVKAGAGAKTADAVVPAGATL